MKRRSAATAAWLLFGIAVTAILAGWLMTMRAERQVPDLAPLTLSWTFPLIGALIVSRRPRNTIGWLFLTIGVVIATQALTNAYGGIALSQGNTSLPARLAYWYASWAWLPPLVLILPFTFLLFPTGRLPSARFRWVAWAAAVGGALVVVAQSMMPWDDESEFGAAVEIGAKNPFGLGGGAESLELLLIAGAVLLLIGAIGGLVAVVVRFHRARGIERKQLHWVTLALVVAGASVLVGDLIPGMSIDHIYAISFPLIPAAAGYAILRHRLYDIDVIVNRALVYGSLTALLVGIYLLSVLSLQFLFAPLTRDSDIAVAASTLGIATLFRPARVRVQSWIDRRFYRRRYDARRSLEAFAAGLRDETDLDKVAADLRAVVSETLQPEFVVVDLR